MDHVECRNTKGKKNLRHPLLSLSSKTVKMVDRVESWKSGKQENIALFPELKKHIILIPGLFYTLV